LKKYQSKHNLKKKSLIEREKTISKNKDLILINKYGIYILHSRICYITIG